MEVYHEEVKETIATVEGAKNIVDGIIVYGKTPELHDKALASTLPRLKSNGLTLNHTKCFLDEPKIQFLYLCFSCCLFSCSCFRVFGS